MAKLTREGRLRDKRAEKEARKAARKLSAAQDAADAGAQAEEIGTAPAGLGTGDPGAAGP